MFGNCNQGGQNMWQKRLQFTRPQKFTIHYNSLF